MAWSEWKKFGGGELKSFPVSGLPVGNYFTNIDLPEKCSLVIFVSDYAKGSYGGAILDMISHETIVNAQVTQFIQYVSETVVAIKTLDSASGTIYYI